MMNSERVAATQDSPAKHGESIISQSPTRKVGDKVFVSVPAPVEVISLKKRTRKA